MLRISVKRLLQLPQIVKQQKSTKAISHTDTPTIVRHTQSQHGSIFELKLALVKLVGLSSLQIMNPANEYNCFSSVSLILKHFIVSPLMEHCMALQILYNHLIES